MNYLQIFERKFRRLIISVTILYNYVLSKLLFLSATHNPIESANLALGKHAWLTSAVKLHANNTVNGNTNPSFTESCMQIEPNVASSWQVDLDTVYDIKQVVIFTKPGKFNFAYDVLCDFSNS